MYRHVLEQIEATSFPPQVKFEDTLGFISFLLPLRVLRYSKGNVCSTGMPKVLLNMAVISSLNWASHQSEVKEIFPTKPFSAKLALESPLGILITEAVHKGKHTMSLVYCLQGLRFLKIFVPCGRLEGTDGRGICKKLKHTLNGTVHQTMEMLFTFLRHTQHSEAIK